MPVDLGMSEAEFMASLGETNGNSQVNRVDVAPITVKKPSFTDRYQRGDVPLDTDTGAPWTTRLKLAFSPDDQTSVASLQQSFKGAQIEPIEDGGFIIRGVADAESGQVKDLLVDEHRISGKDFLDMAAVLPQAAMALVAIRANKGRTDKMTPGFGKIFTEAAIGAAGSQSAGAAMDAAARLLSGQKIDPMEIQKRRTVEGIGEIAISGGLGSVPGLFSKVTKGLSTPATQVQVDGLEAVNRLAEKTGIRVRMTIGEETGNPNLLTAEGIAAKSPTGRSRLKAAQKASDEDMRSIQKFLMGGEPIPVEDASAAAVSKLREIADGLSGEVARRRQAIASKASDELATAISSETGLSRTVLKNEAGDGIRAAIKTHKDAFDSTAERLYSEVGADPLISTKAVADEISAIKKELVKTTRVIGEDEIVTGFDEFGPISVSVDTKGREVLREFVPEGLNRFLGGLSKLDDQTPLSELRALRTQINDAKRQSEIIPGVSTRLLSKFSGAIGRAIDDAAASIDDPGVVARLKTANQFYGENMKRFEPKGVIEILADPDQAKLGNFAVVNQAIRDPDQYFRVKEALTSPMSTPDGAVVSHPNVGSWNLFRKAALTEIEDRARFSGTGEMINPQKFLSELERLEPEVLNDLLGANSSNALSALKAMRALGEVDLNGKANADAVIAALGKGNSAAAEIKALVAEQQKLDGLYSENVIKKFVKGEVDTTAIEPGEFVDRFIDVARDADEVARVMSRLSSNPELAQAIKSRTIQNVFQKAAHNASPEDISRGLNFDPTVMVDPKKMSKELRADEDKLRAVIGNDAFSLLEDYLRVETQRSVKDATASTVGGLVGGSLMNSMLTLDLKKIPSHLKYAFVGMTLSNPTFLKILQRTSDPTAATRAIIVSAPFIEATMEQFGKGPGSAFLRMLGEATGLRKSENSQNAPTSPQMSEEEFLRSLK
jgi:hypothetical protein